MRFNTHAKSKLDERLDIIWNNLTLHGGGFRYEPRWNGAGPHSWDVWDNKLNHWVYAAQVKKLSKDECSERWTQ